MDSVAMDIEDVVTYIRLQLYKMERVVSFYERNYGKASDGLEFWTYAREQRFLWLVQVFDRNWSLIKTQILPVRPQDKALRSLFANMEQLAERLRVLLQQHDELVAMKDLPAHVQEAFKSAPATMRAM